MDKEGRRDQLDIIAEILSICLAGERATHVVYKSNINFKRFKAYAQYLIGKGLLEVLEGPNSLKIYRTTDKGKLFLELLEEMEEKGAEASSSTRWAMAARRGPRKSL